jgi:hypothetical protein
MRPSLILALGLLATPLVPGEPPTPQAPVTSSKDAAAQEEVWRALMALVAQYDFHRERGTVPGEIPARLEAHLREHFGSARQPYQPDKVLIAPTLAVLDLPDPTSASVQALLKDRLARLAPGQAWFCLVAPAGKRVGFLGAVYAGATAAGSAWKLVAIA